MARKHVVKSGISLLFLLIILAAFYFKNSDEDKVKHQTSPQAENLKKRQKVAEKKISTPSTLECSNLHKEIVKEINEKAKGSEVEHWINYFLEKDGIEYVLRIERDENNQGMEIKRINFFKLDEDGFPQPFSNLHGKVVLSKNQISEVLENYKVTQKDKVTSYRDESIIVNWINDKIQKINNRMSNLDCTY